MQNLFIRNYSTTKKIIPYILALGILLFAILIGISIGSVPIPITKIGLAILGKTVYPPFLDQVEPMLLNIIWDIRLPRVLLALLVGASLALA